MTVYELTKEQLDELRYDYFDMNNEDAWYYYNSPDEIPDFVIQNWYSQFTFVNDDFFCTAEM